MADALDLGSSAERRGGSSPPSRINRLKASVRSCLSQIRNLLQLGGETVRRFAGVVTRLHVQPEIGSVAAQLTESDGHVGSYCAHAGHHAMQGLSADVEQRGNLADRAILTAKLWQDVALEKNARVHGRAG